MRERIDVEKKIASVSLTMSRVPVEVYDEFKALSEKSFVGDYGMTLKFIMDENKKLKETFDFLIMVLESKNEK